MSRARELRTNQENVINIYELFERFVPEKKSKYVETLLRLMKNTKGIEEHVGEIKENPFLVFLFFNYVSNDSNESNRTPSHHSN